MIFQYMFLVLLLNGGPDGPPLFFNLRKTPAELQNKMYPIRL